MPQANDQKHVTPKQRPHEFPNQKLVVSGGKQDLSLHDYVERSLILIAVQYRIAENFRGRKLSRFVQNENFTEKTFVD